MEAEFQRHLKSGTQYNALIPKCKDIETILIKGNAGVPDTMVALVRMVYETVDDTKLLAPVLLGKNLKETTSNIWSFIHDHIQYRPDEAGTEQLRRPSRAWKDRKEGVDCDCYSITASSILVNLGIPHLLRITKYKNRPNYQHIYVIVPKNGDTNDKNISVRSNYIVIDCVPDKYDFEVPYSEAHDFAITPNTTNVQHASVNGLLGLLGEVRTVQEFPLTDLTLPTEIPSSSATTSITSQGSQIIENKFFKMTKLSDQPTSTPTTQTDDSSKAESAIGKKNRGGSVILACIFGATVVVMGTAAIKDYSK